MKFDNNFYIGIASVIIFSICGVLSVNSGVLTVLLSVFLFLIASAVIIAVYSVILPKKMKAEADWSVFAPFALMLPVSRIILGWDVFSPFIIAAFLLLTLDLVKRHTLTDKQTAAAFAVGGVSALVFVLISIAGGILV